MESAVAAGGAAIVGLWWGSFPSIHYSQNHKIPILTVHLQKPKLVLRHFTAIKLESYNRWRRSHLPSFFLYFSPQPVDFPFFYMPFFLNRRGLEPRLREGWKLQWFKWSPVGVAVWTWEDSSWKLINNTNRILQGTKSFHWFELLFHRLNLVLVNGMAKLTDVRDLYTDKMPFFIAETLCWMEIWDWMILMSMFSIINMQRVTSACLWSKFWTSNETKI